MHSRNAAKPATAADGERASGIEQQLGGEQLILSNTPTAINPQGSLGSHALQIFAEGAAR
jgi:hypothetical protein